ncbi:response regulator [Xanthobacter sp. V4C-4]|uniref:response regulator transcription factor n=1 Tax=Xanthobacter cornucopiae TaxID=3119924 RepID=UPI0037299B12
MDAAYKVEAVVRGPVDVFAGTGRADCLPKPDGAMALMPFATQRAASGRPQSFAPPLIQHDADPGRMGSAPWVVHIVDDDAAVCNSLKFTFELDGFDVVTYAGFHELMAADLPHCGCMIVDYNLPEINGLELLSELDRRNVHLPSFLITSNPSQNVRRRADAQGVAIIEKPLLGNQLSEAVRDSFTRARPC